MLRKSNYYVKVVTLKKCNKVLSQKTKLLKKSQHIGEGKPPFEKNSQIRLMIRFNLKLFSPRCSLNFQSCVYHKRKNYPGPCFLHLIFLFRDLFLLLFQFPSSKSSSRFNEFSLWCLVNRFLCNSRKRKINRNNHCLSLVVIRCHSLYDSLSLDKLLACLFIDDQQRYGIKEEIKRATEE